MREITYRDALKEALIEEMERDERVFLLGEDIAGPFGSAYKVTLGLPPPFARNMEDFAVIDEHKIADRVHKALQGEI